MAQGNVWVLIEKTSKDALVPVKLKNKWKFKEQVIDEDTGQVINEIDLHPSWLQAANKLRADFGDVRELSIEGKDYILIELELSWQDGEIDEVIKLQSNRNKNFQLYTNSEAIALLNGASFAEIEARR